MIGSGETGAKSRPIQKNREEKKGRDAQTHHSEETKARTAMAKYLLFRVGESANPSRGAQVTRPKLEQTQDQSTDPDRSRPSDFTPSTADILANPNQHSEISTGTKYSFKHCDKTVSGSIQFPVIDNGRWRRDNTVHIRVDTMKRSQYILNTGSNAKVSFLETKPSGTFSSTASAGFTVKKFPQGRNPSSLSKVQTHSNTFARDKSTQGNNQTMSSLTSAQKAVMSLFLGYVVRGDAKCKYYVGKGNNNTLVSAILSQRPGLVSSGDRDSSNIVWTQIISKQLRYTPVLSAIRLHIEDAFPDAESRTVHSLDMDRLCAQFLRLGICTVKNLHLLREVFTHVLGRRTIGLCRHDQCIYPNHLRGTAIIARKCLLAETLINYYSKQNLDPFKVLPRTFIIKAPTADQDLRNFKQILQNTNNYHFPLIIKPGENTNRGTGISMAYSEQDIYPIVENILATTPNKKPPYSVILQNYITNPLLYKGRKFDLRCYALLFRSIDHISFFWYGDGYARTSSFAYNVGNKDNLMVHLTNEAIQVKSSSDVTRQDLFRQVRTRQQGLLLGS